MHMRNHMYFLHTIDFTNVIVIKMRIYEIRINMAKTKKIVYISSIWNLFANYIIVKGWCYFEGF